MTCRLPLRLWFSGKRRLIFKTPIFIFVEPQLGMLSNKFDEEKEFGTSLHQTTCLLV